MNQVPYDSRELGFSVKGTPQIRSGLLGAFFLVIGVLIGMLVALVSIPFLLLGVAEYVSDSSMAGITHWRVRWVRSSK